MVRTEVYVTLILSAAVLENCSRKWSPSPGQLTWKSSVWSGLPCPDYGHIKQGLKNFACQLMVKLMKVFHLVRYFLVLGSKADCSFQHCTQWCQTATSKFWTMWKRIHCTLFSTHTLMLCIRKTSALSRSVLFVIVWWACCSCSQLD